ncbi:MAG: 50S ribosomal protein L17 [Acidobacteria bacterium]|nr:MAG: 50S ribosomal protein L17 [Acidobacteriota bacterium]
MRHGMANRKLGRTSAHRAALFRNQLASLIDKERIITTLPKAKELRPQIERLVTLGKNDSLHNRRQAERVVGEDTLIAKLFTTLGPRFNERPGGYTRIIKLGARRGDAAEMAILEFVGYEPKIEEAPAEEKGGGKKAAPKKEAAEETEAAAEAKPKKKAAPKKAASAKKPAKAAAPKKKARTPGTKRGQ